jgi:hypothetical protein
MPKAELLKLLELLERAGRVGVRAHGDETFYEATGAACRVAD